MKFTDKMPRNRPRGHTEPAWRGDRLQAIRDQRHRINVAKAKGKKVIPPNALDINFHWYWNDPDDHSKGGEWFAVHYIRPGLNNFRFYLEPGAKVARRMTRRELVRTRWTADQVRRWRRTNNPASARPNTYLVMAELGHELDIYVCAEWKATAAGRSAIPARKFVADARTAGHPPWAMALLNMAAIRGKVAHLIAEGGQFALIFGRFARTARKPKDWPWSPPPTRIWNGSKRLQAWLK